MPSRGAHLVLSVQLPRDSMWDKTKVAQDSWDLGSGNWSPRLSKRSEWWHLWPPMVLTDQSVTKQFFSCGHHSPRDTVLQELSGLVNLVLPCLDTWTRVCRGCPWPGLDSTHAEKSEGVPRDLPSSQGCALASRWQQAPCHPIRGHSVVSVTSLHLHPGPSLNAGLY